MNIQRYFILGLVVLSFFMHVAWLGYPREIVFDEVHFGKFVTAYCCSGERVFDIHPPHGKLIIAGVAAMGGYSGGFNFDSIGDPYDAVPIFSLRLAAALAGALIPILGYILLRQVGVSFAGALFGGFVLLFDNALILQSRLIALDSLLVASTFSSLALFWVAEKQRDRMRDVLFVVAGGMAGLAAGIKFTGLVGLAVLGIVVLYFLGRSKHKDEALSWVRAGLLILVGALFVYGAGWWLHYSLLQQPGPGDAWQVPMDGFVRNTIDMHKIMFNANYNLTATHPYSSFWWSWPVMQRPVFYWQGAGGGREYLIGNPVVWWGGGLLFVMAVLFSLGRASKHVRQGTYSIFPTSLIPLRTRLREDTELRGAGNFQFSKSNRGWLFLLGYVVAYLPFMRIPRALFLYHYFTPLVFSLLFGIAWFDMHLSSSNDGLRKAKIIYALCGLGVVVGFVFFSPLTYGFSAPVWSDLLFWFASWR